MILPKKVKSTASKLQTASFTTSANFLNAKKKEDSTSKESRSSYVFACTMKVGTLFRRLSKESTQTSVLLEKTESCRMISLWFWSKTGFWSWCKTEWGGLMWRSSTRWLSSTGSWTAEKARKNVSWMKGSTSFWIKWKTFKERGCLTLLKTITTSPLLSKKTFPSYTKTSGVPTLTIPTNSRLSAALNTLTEPSFLRICGSSKAFAGSSILKSVFCWTLVPNPLKTEFWSIYKHLLMNMWVEWLALWV